MTGPSTAPSTQQGLGISAEPSGGQMAGPSPGLSSEPTVSADPARRLGIPALSGDLAEEFRLFMEFKQFSEMLKDASLTTVATAGPAVQAVQPPRPCAPSHADPNATIKSASGRPLVWAIPFSGSSTPATCCAACPTSTSVSPTTTRQLSGDSRIFSPSGYDPSSDRSPANRH